VKIALLTDGIYPFAIGGMQKHSYYLAKYFLQAGIDLTIIHCCYNQDIPLNHKEQLAKALGVETVDAEMLVFPKIRFSFPGHYVYESYLYSKEVYTRIQKKLSTFDFIYIKGFSGWYTFNQLKNTSHPIKGLQFHGIEMFQPAFSFRELLEKIILRWPVKSNLAKTDIIFSYGGKDLGIV
jgi:hypothetical protein